MRGAPPPKAKTAVVLFGLYGILLLAGAVLLQVGAAEATGLGRAWIRIAAIWIIAFGLWRGARWAWLAGLALPGLWLALGGYSFVRLFVGDPPAAAPLPFVVYVGSALLILATGWALLLSRDVRSAYQRDA